MDLRQLRISQARPSTKVAVFLLFLLQVLVGIACGLLALYGPVSEHSSLLQAAAYALGAGLPFFALVLLLVTARTGARAIEARTVQFLTCTIPRKLQQLELEEPDPAKHCKPFNGQGISVRERRTPTPSQLDLSLSADGSFAFYRLVSRTDEHCLELWLSVDVALTQATVCFFVAKDQLQDNDRLASACVSTLEGASKSGDYRIDDEEPVVTIGGVEHRKLILRKKLSSDEFLWDSSQTFFFATDLGLMVTSFLRDCKHLLASPIHPPQR